MTSRFLNPTVSRGLRLPSRGLARTSRSKATSEFAHPSRPTVLGELDQAILGWDGDAQRWESASLPWNDSG